MQHAANGRDVIVNFSGPDPREHLVDCVGVGEDVVRRLPVGMFVGIAKACHSECRPVSEGSAEVSSSGSCADRVLECTDVLGWIVAEQFLGECRVVCPAMCAAAGS